MKVPVQVLYWIGIQKLTDSRASSFRFDEKTFTPWILPSKRFRKFFITYHSHVRRIGRNSHWKKYEQIKPIEACLGEVPLVTFNWWLDTCYLDYLIDFESGWKGGINKIYVNQADLAEKATAWTKYISDYVYLGDKQNSLNTNNFSMSPSLKATHMNKKVDFAEKRQILYKSSVGRCKSTLRRKGTYSGHEVVHIGERFFTIRIKRPFGRSYLQSVTYQNVVYNLKDESFMGVKNEF